jgi:PIN domain nuclease of toxin-antitoxin system
LNQPQRLTPDIRRVLQSPDATIFYSAISLWEISIKFGLGKLDLLGHSPEELFAELEQSFFIYRQLDAQALISSYHLPQHHKDPFDRMLFWEAICNDLMLLSADNKSDAYQSSGLRSIH